MSDIGVPSSVQSEDPPQTGGRRLVPMEVGSAVVYIEPLDDPAVLQDEGELRPVGANPADAFEAAGNALRECVSVVGRHVTSSAKAGAEAIVPDTVSMEFTLTFDVEGRATIVPVLLTGKAKSAMGIKVSAQWYPRGGPPAGGP